MWLIGADSARFFAVSPAPRESRPRIGPMPYAPLLNDAEIAEGLGRLPGWSREGDWIVRAVRLPTFRAAIDLVDRVADVAEAADHHPDMEIVWRRVTFRLTTKASGGISEKDLAMAAQIDQLAEPAAE